MTNRLELLSSLTVAMSRWCCGSAVNPSHRPVTCQLLRTRPLLAYCTTVLSVALPAGSPFGPTPFCHETKIDPCNDVMSSGLLMTLPPAMIPPDANTVVVKPVDWP